MTQDINCRARIQNPDFLSNLDPRSRHQKSNRYQIRIRNTASDNDQDMIENRKTVKAFYKLFDWRHRGSNNVFFFRGS
jgi:hypothetical protein